MAVEHAWREPVAAMVPPGQMKSLTSDMTAIISAHMTLAEVETILGEHEQWLAIDGPSDVPVGTLVEFNSSGPLRLGFGAWRDLILGVQFVNGKGELITAGGQTLKNVAGYDLSKFMIGQGGVFGEVVTVTTRTYRRPGGALLVRMDADVGTLPKVMSTAIRPHWAVLSGDWLYFGYLGDEAALDFYQRSVGNLSPLEAVRRTVAQDIAHRASLWQCLPGQHPQAPYFYRASVPPVRVLEFVRRAKSSWWAADAAFGIVLGVCDAHAEIATVRSAAAAVGGTALIRSTSDGRIVESGADAVQQKLLARLKNAFDPENSLAPLPQ
jgi:glycolate oxidase FAD binding subunit